MVQFLNQGFCKAGPGCVFDHTDVDCETYILGGNHVGTENATMDTELFVNTVTVKAAVLEE